MKNTENKAAVTAIRIITFLAVLAVMIYLGSHLWTLCSSLSMEILELLPVSVSPEAQPLFVKSASLLLFCCACLAMLLITRILIAIIIAGSVIKKVFGG